MKKKLIKTAIIFLIASLFALAILISRGFKYLIDYSDAFFISGTIFIFIGLLSLISTFGTFNTFGYSFYSISRSTKKERKYKDFNDYNDQKGTKHQSNRFAFVPYVSIGGLFAVIGAILSFLI